MRMELEKQRIDMERKREEAAMHRQREAAVTLASSIIDVPTIHETTPPAMEVPTDILQVRPHTPHLTPHTHTHPHTGSYEAGPPHYLPR